MYSEYFYHGHPIGTIKKQCDRICLKVKTGKKTEHLHFPYKNYKKPKRVKKAMEDATEKRDEINQEHDLFKNNFYVNTDTGIVSVHVKDENYFQIDQTDWTEDLQNQKWQFSVTSDHNDEVDDEFICNENLDKLTKFLLPTEHKIYHIDKNPYNCRRDNLDVIIIDRQAEASKKRKEERKIDKRNKTGYPGVSVTKDGKTMKTSWIDASSKKRIHCTVKVIDGDTATAFDNLIDKKFKIIEKLEQAF